jgi:hypothetical protein
MVVERLEVLCSRPGILTDFFRGLPQFLQNIAGIVP